VVYAVMSEFLKKQIGILAHHTDYMEKMGVRQVFYFEIILEYISLYYRNMIHRH